MYMMSNDDVIMGGSARLGAVVRSSSGLTNIGTVDNGLEDQKAIQGAVPPRKQECPVDEVDVDEEVVRNEQCTKILADLTDWQWIFGKTPKFWFESGDTKQYVEAGIIKENTAEAAVRRQESVLEMDQDKANVQGSEVRDVVGEIQKLQEKQAKDMMRNDEEMSDEDME
ncbi:unnamed protein product, partial [Haemonchus placei]|uniref:Uncharacterized protein n=1 Tax=Haemonchus placei TaxID=6290 RepID=A0A0N4X507_HAEPC